MHTARGKVLEAIHRDQRVIYNAHASSQILRVLTDPDAAHFVVEDRVMRLILRDEVHEGFKAMHRAGIHHLPFDPVMIEFRHLVTGDPTFVRLSTKPIVPPIVYVNEPTPDIWAYPIGAVREGHGYICASCRLEAPIRIYFGDPDGVGDDRAFTVYIEPGNDEQDALIKQGLSLCSSEAMAAAYLMLNTRGIEKVHVDTTKLDHAREKAGKPRIGSYSVVKIGSIYDRDGTAHSVTGSGRHMPVHWRVGHTRMQRYGPRWSKQKLIYIPPVLVNYDDATLEPAPPRHEVTI